MINRIWPKKAIIEEEKPPSPEEIPEPFETIPEPEEVLPEERKPEDEKPEETLKEEPEKEKPKEEKPKTTPPEKKATPVKLNARQKKAIEYLKKKKKITRAEYSKKFKCSIATAGRDLKDMTEKGLIEPETDGTDL